MRLKLVCATFVIVTFSSYIHAQDWGEINKSLETIGKILEEGDRAKREGREADMDRVYGYTNDLIDYKEENYRRQQEEQQRRYDQQRAAEQSAYQNSSQYKHNQELMKALNNEKSNGYGSANNYERQRQQQQKAATSYQSNSSSSSSSTRYRPPQPSNTRSAGQRSAGYTPSYTSNSSGSSRPSGLTVNQSRSNYVPGKNAGSYSGNTYDADDLDASGIGLDDVRSTPPSQTSSSGTYVGGSMPQPGRCLEWVEVPPYPCGDIFGIAQASGEPVGTCNTRCSKYEYR